jgi:predicted DCC family thiol-disulfide oxidoreductase YuxK
LQWALARIAELETHSTNLLTENGILWQQSEAATHEADQLRERLERLDRLRRLVPGPLRRVASKISN